MPRNKAFFYANPVRDAELLAFLAGLGNKSAYIREAIYEKIARDKGQRTAETVSRAELDLAQIVVAVRQAVRDELLVVRLAPAPAPAPPDPDREREQEAQRKLTNLFGAWDVDDQDTD